MMEKTPTKCNQTLDTILIQSSEDEIQPFLKVKKKKDSYCLISRWLKVSCLSYLLHAALCNQQREAGNSKEQFTFF